MNFKEQILTFQRVMVRELRRVRRQPRYVIILTLLATLIFTFFATMMHEGIPEKLPVAVVDLDGSYLSRRLCHELNATQSVEVVAIYNNHTEARKAMQRGEIFAFYEIPEGMYNDLLNFRSPHFGLYSNTAYLLAGMLSYKQLARLGMLAAGAVQREVLRKKGYDDNAIQGLIQPVNMTTHQIGNPWTSYRIYLMTTIVPVAVSFIVILLTVYLIGREVETKGVNRLMRHAHNNAVVALAGKLFPYWFWFSLLALIFNLIMFGPMHYPMNGSWLLMMANTMLLVFAAQCAGVMIAGCLPDAPFSMGVGGIYGALSFSLSGFSFPVEHMPRIFNGISLIYPARHYFLNYRDIAFFGNGLEHCWPSMCALIGFGVLWLIGAWRFQHNFDRGLLVPSSKTLEKKEKGGDE
ncbi:MAG: ABC transporter permease [Bacteroidales bacterium]|nr:ABC transporter permease [Bacteroidales bacterium]